MTYLVNGTVDMFCFSSCLCLLALITEGDVVWLEAEELNQGEWYRGLER